VDALVGDLSIGQRQMVAILQALAANAELIVMDEPTASLANEEREIVYRTIRHLTRVEGKSTIFVSHFLDEVMALTDEATVLRDGVAVLHAATADLDEAKIAEAIVGRAVAAIAERARTSHGPKHGPKMTRRRPSSRSIVCPLRESSPSCSFELRAGEVLGIAGFLGAGRSELLHAIFGADSAARGDVRIFGNPVARSRPLP